MTDVQTFINERPFSRFQWLIWTMCFAVVLMDGFDTGAIGFVAPSLQSEWGIQKQALAPVLSAALFGLACGALLVGPIADRFGRRMPLIASVLIFGVASFGSAFAENLTELTVLRFLTGIGLGAALPNAVTMMSEYCQDRRRATLTNLMTCGFPVGAALGGFLAAWLIPHFGWRSVLLVGGGAPILLALLLLLMLPESIRFMVAKGYPTEKIRAALARIDASAINAGSFVTTEYAALTTNQRGVRIVLSSRYLIGTLMLWLASFMGLVIFYGSINWMPVLLKEAGLDSQHATLVSTLFPLGGIGAVFCGMVMDRFNPPRVIAACYGLTAISVYCIGQAVASAGLLMVVVFAAGVLLNTSQASMPTLAAGFYPTQGRATGVAWMVGISRFGGIAGSFLIAELTRREISFDEIFAALAIAGGVASIALFVSQAARPPSPVSDLGTNETLAH
jgi:AAHS family 4-hydroxybenzoate transporter-like MFS transporter